jgi:5-methylcytosine-specific restriction endonuclease McrA
LSETFRIETTEEEVKREKTKARALRQTRWWHQKIARGECHYCGRKFPPGELTMDHVVPIIRGGKTTKGNVAPACRDCNGKKKYLLPMEWEAYMEGFRTKK